MTRNAASYFRRLVTILVSIALMQVHVAKGTTIKLSACKFNIETHMNYHAEGGNLLAEGYGSVTLQDVVCICHIAKPSVTIFYPQGERNVSNYSLTSPICKGVPSCDDMPENFGSANFNITSMVNITGTFNQTALIECGTLMNPNKPKPLIVWVQPLVPAASTSLNLQPQPTSSSMAPSSSEITMTTTTVTNLESLLPSSTSETSSYTMSTIAEASLCATMTSTVSVTTTLILSTSMLPTLSSTLPTFEYNVALFTTAPILIIIIIVLLVALAITIIIARSTHKTDREQVFVATNQMFKEVESV